MTPKTVDLIYFNAGGGHRAAAQALAAAIEQQQRPWQVRRVNLMEVLDPLGRFKKVTGMAPEDYYNKRLAKGWTLGLTQELKLLQGMIHLGHATLVRRLRQHWLRTEPDLVVSLVPNFNHAMVDALTSALPGVPYVTVMTDMADHPPNFWIEPALPAQHVVCGTARAVAQARAAGVPEARIHATSGMIVRPDFYAPVTWDRDDEMRSLGLDPSLPTGVVMFGGQGSMAMLSIAQQLTDVQLILMCGHHAALVDKLRKQSSDATHTVLGFTQDVRRYLSLGDFFIGKPGPGCLSEAVQQGLPVITLRNAWTMPQERYNTDWVLEHELGLVSRSIKQLGPTVRQFLPKLANFKANVRRLDNQAVFEVPAVLAGLLADSEGSTSWLAPVNAKQARADG